MKRLAVVSMTLLGACVASESHPEDFPALPAASSDPASGTGGGGGTPAGFVGRVCVPTSLRDFSACGAEAAGGLTVTLGAQVATTAQDGTFTFAEPPRGSNLAFSVEGEGIVPTTTPFSPATTIHAIDADLYARELTSNGLSLADGTGGILGTVTSADGVPTSGVSVESSPLGAGGPFYDGDGDAFTTNRTGARGVFFVPGVTFGAADLTFTGASAGQSTLVNGVSVVNGGVTILDSVVLP